MTSMIILGLLMAFLFAGLMIGLGMAYRDEEKRRAAETHVHGATVGEEAVAKLPRFFADLRGGPDAELHEDDQDERVGQFEDYVRAEQALVAQFVKDPSIENLYRQSPASPLLQ